MVRWAPRLAWVCALLAAIPLSCSSSGAPSDGGSDVSIPCSTNADCPTGTACLYTGNGGCSEAPHCLPIPDGGACPPTPACSCTGYPASISCGVSSARIGSLGACEGGSPCHGGACCSGLACELCDVSGYAPVTMSKPVVTMNACTPTEIASAVSACYGANATPLTCIDWQQAQVDAGASACAACVVTLQSAAAWGPFVCTANVCSLNVAGCVDLVLGDVGLERSSGGKGSCGDYLSDSFGCQDYACNTCSSASYATCGQAAIGNECKSYADAVYSPTGPCASLAGDSAPNAAPSCFPLTAGDIPKLVNVFCGTGP